MGQRTPMYDLHLALGAKMVDFGGWDMPLHYGSQVEEHHEVRRDCGVFDVSHMTVIDVGGAQAREWLQYLLANDVERLQTPGRALYSAMLNEKGGVVDDMIVYLRTDGYRLVVNAATRDQDLAWMTAQSRGYDVQVQERPELALLAIQGPQARHKVAELVSQARVLEVLHKAGIDPEQTVSAHDVLLEPVSLYQVIHMDHWIMVRAANMKITLDTRDGRIVNISGGGCPDVPWLAHCLCGLRLAEAPEPLSLGQTLCCYSLQKAFEELRRQYPCGT